MSPRILRALRRLAADGGTIKLHTNDRGAITIEVTGAHKSKVETVSSGFLRSFRGALVEACGWNRPHRRAQQRAQAAKVAEARRLEQQAESAVKAAAAEDAEESNGEEAATDATNGAENTAAAESDEDAGSATEPKKSGGKRKK